MIALARPTYGVFVAVGGAMKAAPAERPAVSDFPLTTVPVAPGSFDANDPPELLVHPEAQAASPRITNLGTIARREARTRRAVSCIVPTPRSEAQVGRHGRRSEPLSRDAQAITSASARQ
jgi:hypothetical protein